MKIIIPILLFFLCSFNLYSQWGVKGGVNYTKITGSSLQKYKLFGHIGGTYDVKLSDKWYFQPELLFTSVGCDLKDDRTILRGGHINIYALELPLNLSFRPTIAEKMNLLLDFGLYARYGLFGNKTYKYHDSSKIDNSPFDAFNRFDTGVNLGVGLQRNQYYGILSFQRGLSRATKGDSEYHQVFKLSFGYKL